MGNGEQLSFSLPTTRFTRGGVVRVRIGGDRSQYRAVRLELLQVQRKLKVKLDAKKNHAVVVASVDVPLEVDEVEFAVPGHLPNTYRGTLIAWDYELRLIGDLPGRPDAEHVQAIDLSGSEPTIGSETALLALRTSNGARRARLVERSDSDARGGVIAFAVVAAAVVGLGLMTGARPMVVMGVILLVPAVVGVVMPNSRKRQGMQEVEFRSPTGPIRLGQPVAVQVVGALGHSLEVGLVAYELSVEGSGSHTVAVQHVAYEHWLPVVGSTVSLPTSTSHPPSLAGHHISLHWVVVLRRTDVSRTAQRTSARTVPVAIVH